MFAEIFIIVTGPIHLRIYSTKRKFSIIDSVSLIMIIFGFNDKILNIVIFLINYLLGS